MRPKVQSTGTGTLCPTPSLRSAECGVGASSVSPSLSIGA